MDIHELTAELNAIFSDSAEQIKAHLAHLQYCLDNSQKRRANIESRVLARIERGIAKQLIKKHEARDLRYYARRIAHLKLMIRAIKEGMAYRSMA
jgi:tRNA C32,U32 (ribose-2'-O)-methylase TrmJ